MPAFGKAPSKMNLRQQMQRSTKKTQRGGGGGAPYYVNNYQPPKVGSDIIRLIPGHYKMPRIDDHAKDFVRDEHNQPVFDEYPYFKYTEYYHAVKERSCIGSEGWLGNFKGKGEPCIAADWYWWEWRQRRATGAKNPNAMSRREKWVITVLVEAPFYKVPQVDRQTGQVRMNTNTNQPYFDWKQGSKRGKDEYALAGYEHKDGHLMHWSLGYGHWKTLIEYADSLSNDCRSCHGQGTINELALLCQSCGDAVVDFSSTTLSDEDLLKIRNDEVTCPHCKYHGYLEDLIQCGSCGNGDRATMFDYDLEVKRVETAGQGGNQTVLQIVRAIGPKPIDNLYGEDMRKPLPLEKIFAPTELSKQEDLFGRPPSEDTQAQPDNTRQPSNMGTRPYGS